MDNIILLKIIISFFVGGGVVLLVAFLSEKLGSVLGAIFAAVPTTVAVSLFFQGITINTDAVVQACGGSLVGLSVFGFFCVTYVYLARFNFIVALCCAIAAWLSVMLVFIWSGIEQMSLCFVIFLITVCVSKWMLGRRHVEKIPFTKGRMNPFWVHGLRFSIGGGVIAFSVFMGVVAGEVIGGVFSAFPGMAVSVIIILNHSMGRHFTVDFIKNIYMNAVLNVGVYTLAVYFLYTPLGLIWGTVFSYVLSIIPAVILYRMQMMRE